MSAIIEATTGRRRPRGSEADHQRERERRGCGELVHLAPAWDRDREDLAHQQQERQEPERALARRGFERRLRGEPDQQRTARDGDERDVRVELNGLERSWRFRSVFGPSRARPKGRAQLPCGGTGSGQEGSR
jgi:hypothetical protein